MTVPLTALAAGSVAAGWIGLPKVWTWFGDGFRLFEHWLEPVFARSAHLLAAEADAHAHDLSLEWLLMGLSVAIAAAGIALARHFYIVRPEAPEYLRERAAPVYNVLYNKWYVDEIYDFLFVNGLGKGGGTVLSRFDSKIVDGGVNGTGWLTRFLSALSVWWDTWIVDGAVRLLAFTVKMTSYPVRIVQSGYLQSYALFILAGVALALGYYLTR
jgi:NADH-quinone oxidoreductase subunit L